MDARVRAGVGRQVRITLSVHTPNMRMCFTFIARQLFVCSLARSFVGGKLIVARAPCSCSLCLHANHNLIWFMYFSCRLASALLMCGGLTWDEAGNKLVMFAKLQYYGVALTALHACRCSSIACTSLITFSYLFSYRISVSSIKVSKSSCSPLLRPQSYVVELVRVSLVSKLHVLVSICAINLCGNNFVSK